MKTNSLIIKFIVIAKICIIVTTVMMSCKTSVYNAIIVMHFTDFTFVGTVSPNTRQTMQNNANEIFRQIHESYFSKKQSVLPSLNNATKETIVRTQALWSLNKFYCVETEVIVRVLEMPNKRGYQVRNIPVFFADGATEEDKYQDMVLEFTSDGQISDLYIALPMNQYSKIFETGNGVTDMRRRQIILEFLENFITAYYCRDITFIDKMYGNDVLIITGKELKRSGNSPNLTGVDEKNVIYSKSEYMQRLKTVFANNSFINFKFDEIEVIKDEEKDNIYGVTLRQHWNTSSYSDGGWMFLMIDFKNEYEPLIWIRTWQPLETPRNKVFDLFYGRYR